MSKLQASFVRSVICGSVAMMLAVGVALAQAPAAVTGTGQQTALRPQAPRVLIVVAHPDDEACFAATVYEITHNLGGVVDQMVITNGEGGYRYSLLAEPVYGVALTDEAVGRAALPEIRKRELLEAGKILGIANHFFLDQRDVRYTQDIDEVLNEHWRPGVVLPEVERRLAEGHYDFVFTLFPSPETHGAHKASTITALNAVEETAGRGAKPVVLGCQDVQSGATEPSWQGLVSALHPFRVEPEVFVTDRAVKFGFRDALDYQIIVNWVIAAHKSQGAFQMDMNRADREEFVVLESATASEAADKAADEARARGLFHAIAEQATHPKGLAACKP
ncbi:MAG: PIG-L family deacetylase [Candidatus Korobacteraceae bacterium]